VPTVHVAGDSMRVFMDHESFREVEVRLFKSPREFGDVAIRYKMVSYPTFHLVAKNNLFKKTFPSKSKCFSQTKATTFSMILFKKHYIKKEGAIL
jgi:hypothetical protein